MKNKLLSLMLFPVTSIVFAQERDSCWIRTTASIGKTVLNRKAPLRYPSTKAKVKKDDYP